MIRISWIGRRTSMSILEELNIRKRLSGYLTEKIIKSFGHVIRRNGREA